MENATQNAPESKVADSSNPRPRRESILSEDSQTARQYIDAQLKLEADAREALPYSFDSCTRPLGALRQPLFSCLTCNPPPSDPDAPYTAAGVCYSCSICCHGEHNLVELFTRRNFVCDCGTSRLPSTSACTLRADEKTGVKGVHSEEPAPDNKYNHNYKNTFCCCGELYDPHQEKSTMFQCLGVGTVETGGCGEDWFHPECLLGLPRNWNDAPKDEDDKGDANEIQSKPDGEVEDEPPLPPGFPGEDDFETFICYKCLDANPWLKRYAGTSGFLPPVFKKGASGDNTDDAAGLQVPENPSDDQIVNGSKKRKYSDAADDEPDAKRAKEEGKLPTSPKQDESSEPAKQKHDDLPAQASTGVFSLFLKEDFREHLCHCTSCFPNLVPHLQLREEEDVYEPPLSEAGDAGDANGSQHSGSLLERGEAALSNVDRVRAIEGVMVYNHLRDKVKEFLKPFAETGEAVSADAIKGYFEKLRGDDQTTGGQASSASGTGEGGDGGGDNRREQSGY